MNFYTKLLLCFVICLFVISSEQCSQGYPFEHYLGTRTPYRIVSNHSFDKIQYEGCIAKKVWMIVRHGTRNPSSSNIETINNRLPEIKELILDSQILPNEYIKNRDLDLFRKWKPHLDIRDENKLTHEGEEEMLLLAERMQSRFPGVFDNVYSNTTYRFKYTFSQRTKKSAYYFAAGLFGKYIAKDVWFPEPNKRDPILRFYKLCEKWNKDIKARVRQSGEHRQFASTSHVQKLVTEINKRLGLNDDELDITDIWTMYIACGFETAWNKRSKSPWCSPFSEDNLKVLAYMEDLKYYWQDGYGHELTYKQACPAFGDMIRNFDTTNSPPKVTVYFTHSGTLLKMLAHMGLYKDDEPLVASDFEKRSNRRWRTSLIDSFGTNLAFVLFDCKATKKILVLHQEKIARLPSCPDSDLCEYKKINDYYNQSIDSCDFNEMCENSG